MTFQTFNPLTLIKPRDSSLQAIMGNELENSFKRVRNKYAEPTAQATLGLHQAQAQEHQMKARQMMQDVQLLNAIFGGQLGGDIPGQVGMQGQTEGQPQGQSQWQPQQQLQGQPQEQSQAGMFAQPASQYPGQTQQYPGQAQQGYQQPLNLSNATPLQLEAVRTRLKAGQPQFTSLPGGETLVHEPLAGTSVQQLGTRPEVLESLKTYGAEKAKAQVQAEEESNARYTNLARQMPIFDELTRVVNDKNFPSTTGTFSQILAQYHPNQDIAALQAQFNLLSGDLVNKASSVYGNNVKVSQYNAIKKMKANTSDMPMANKAKVNLMHQLAMDEMQFEKARAHYLANKYSKIEAAEMATKSVDTRGVKNIIETDNIAHNIASLTKRDYEAVMKKAYVIAEKYNVTPLEALQVMQGKK